MFNKLEELNKEFEYREDMHKQQIYNFTNDRLMALPKYNKLLRKMVNHNKTYNHYFNRLLDEELEYKE